MAEQIGIISENQAEGWAVVMTDRKGACGGCHTHGDGCRSCMSGSKLESRVANPINAQAGDVVKINLKSTDLFKGAFILYFIPVACLMSAAYTGASLAGRVGWSANAGSVLGGLIGLVAGVGLVMLLDRSRYVRQHMTPTITQVITPVPGRTKSNTTSCCG
jgi:sigma-E factor negative regulatory protein RseC